jgi:hypothetical protein
MANTKTTHSIAQVRAIISSLLYASEREFQLEHEAIGVPVKEFDDNRRLGVVTFTLATICFNNPDALKRLEKRVADINRQVHLLEARQTKDTKREGRVK